MGALTTDKDKADSVVETLRLSARDTVPFAVRHKVNEYVSKQMTLAINLNSNPEAEDFSGEILGAADRSLDRLSKLRSDTLSDSVVRNFEKSVRSEIETAFADGSWRSVLPGRSILRSYSNRLGLGISYETLRTLIVNRMVEDGFQPEGMKEVFDEIIQS